MVGLLGNSLPPGLAGFVTQRQLAGQEQNQQLGQIQGLLGIQQAQMQQGQLQKDMEFKGLLGQKLQAGDQEGAKQVLMQWKPELFASGLAPKAPSWKETALKNPDGTVKRGYVDINSPTPEATFRPLGVEPVKLENVNGVFFNPYTQTESIPSPTNPFNVVPKEGGGYKLEPNQPVQDFQIRKAATGAAKTKVEVNPALDPFKNEDTLRKEYTAHPVIKNANEMAGAFRLIETAYKNPTPANDLAMATKYMKILDPTSVVRESELGLAMGSVGLLDKVYNYADMISSGKKLTPTQRKDFYESAKAINDAFQKQAGGIAAQYRGIASQYGLKPENVTLERPESAGVLEQADAILRGAANGKR